MPTKPPAGAAAAAAAPVWIEPRPAGGPAARRGDAFDLWLRRGLRQSHDSVAAEPIPEDLRRLVEGDRAERDRVRRR
jgi:hypothetical protein